MIIYLCNTLGACLREKTAPPPSLPTLPALKALSPSPGQRENGTGRNYFPETRVPTTKTTVKEHEIFNDYLQCSRNLHRECRGAAVCMYVFCQPPDLVRGAFFSSVINPRAARSSHTSVFRCVLPKHTNTLTQQHPPAQMGPPPPKSIICV